MHGKNHGAKKKALGEILFSLFILGFVGVFAYYNGALDIILSYIETSRTDSMQWEKAKEIGTESAYLDYIRHGGEKYFNNAIENIFRSRQLILNVTTNKILESRGITEELSRIIISRTHLKNLRISVTIEGKGIGQNYRRGFKGAYCYVNANIEGSISVEGSEKVLKSMNFDLTSKHEVPSSISPGACVSRERNAPFSTTISMFMRKFSETLDGWYPNRS